MIVSSDMFTTARYFIKTSFVFFAVGLGAGLYIYAANLFGWFVPTTLVSAHTHILLVGGVLMMILGVAVWFFPRPPKDNPKYNPTLVLMFYGLFTLATSLRFILEVLAGIYVLKAFFLGGFLASIFQVVAIVGLIYQIWGRIRPVGSQVREKKGERF